MIQPSQYWAYPLANLIPACDSSNLAFYIVYSPQTLNKQSDNMQPCTPFPILNQSVVSCLVLTIASLFAYNFLRIYAQQWDCWVIGQYYFQLFKGTPSCSPQWLYQFTLPPSVQEDSLFSTHPPAFIVYRFFDDGHSDQCELITHCSFDLHVSNNQ